MHYFQTKGSPPVSFNYNQDFSGDVRIRIHNTAVDVLIPADALLEFVAQCFILPGRESRLDNITTQELLR